jgi:uncharacterized protein YraI
MAPTAFVQVDLLNLRGGPGTDFPIVGTATRDAALPISGRDPAFPEWWQVSNGEQTVWVYASLVRAAGPLDQTPVVEAVGVTSASQAVAGISVNNPQQATNKPYLSRQP